MKLEDCQYKGKNTFVGAQQKWELKEVSIVYYGYHSFRLHFFSLHVGHAFDIYFLVCLLSMIEPVILHARMEHVFD